MSTGSIDEFVSKVYAEGVEAGREAGGRLEAEAQKRAAQIETEARNRAARIVEDARSEVEVLREHLRAELELAARDLLLELQRGIAAVLERVVENRARRDLASDDFIAELIRATAAEYAREDSRQIGVFTVDLESDRLDRLGDWVLEQLRDELGEKPQIRLRDRLEGAGFALGLDEATLEVTPESVAELLKSKISKAAREIVRGALAAEDRS